MRKKIHVKVRITKIKLKFLEKSNSNISAFRET